MNQREQRPLWAAVMLLAGSLAGAAAGWLSWLASDNVPTALLAGGGTFAGAVLLLLALFNFVAG
ncbi:hypothetical protein [Cryptosporangium sp. NPDC051539]|uniref:hypothetical protein n=1 Tax=Cryptosporangium sp. NPDC051539 TaxID=3363962 RepID=UPI00378A9B54